MTRSIELPATAIILYVLSSTMSPPLISTTPLVPVLNTSNQDGLSGHPCTCSLSLSTQTLIYYLMVSMILVPVASSSTLPQRSAPTTSKGQKKKKERKSYGKRDLSEIKIKQVSYGVYLILRVCYGHDNYEPCSYGGSRSR